MATAKKAAKKSGAKKSAAKKGAAKKSATLKKPTSKSEEQKTDEAPESQPDFLARRKKENTENTQQVRDELGLPPDYQFNPNEIDPDRSAQIEKHKAGLANRERLNKEAEGQKVS